MSGARTREGRGEDGEEGRYFESENDDVIWESEGWFAVEEVIGSCESVTATEEGDADKIELGKKEKGAWRINPEGVKDRGEGHAKSGGEE